MARLDLTESGSVARFAEPAIPHRRRIRLHLGRDRGIAASRHRGIAASRHRGIAASRTKGKPRILSIRTN
jgi:hypothetical protein